jgi:hypothetical protein
LPSVSSTHDPLNHAPRWSPLFYASIGCVSTTVITIQGVASRKTAWRRTLAPGAVLGWLRLSPTDVEFSRIGGVRQEPLKGHGTPAPIPARRPDAKPAEGLGQTEQGPVRFQIVGEDRLDHGAFGRLDRHTGRITRPIWRRAITVGRDGPGREHAGLPCPLAPAAHAFGHQRALIFGHGSPDVQEQMGLRVLAQRLTEERDAAPCLRESFEAHHLMGIMARQTGWTGHQDPVDRALLDPVPQAVASGSAEGGTAIPIITEDILWT